MGETHYIADILILLAGAVIAVPLFQRIGLGAVLGFLFAGAMVGPWGFGFIVAVEEIRHLAEFGVVFLLFIIGIELKPSRLWVMRRSVFGLGSAQVIITGILITLVALAFGLTTRTALFVGFGLALSSTAFGLQILSDKQELGTGYGRTSFAILLLQDLAIVPMMALIPLLASQELTVTQDVELAAVESIVIIVGVFVLGRTLLRPALQLIAGSRRNPEIFTATGILLVLGAAWLTDWAGLSMALGAFLGGLLLADSRYRHQIMADIQPFRGLLLGLFFMSVGMSINFGLIASEGVLVFLLVAALLLLKASVIWGLCRLTGRTTVDAAKVALLLAQAGEFGFILFGLGNAVGVVDGSLYQLLLLIIALSMVATPFLVRLAPMLDRGLAQSTPEETATEKPIPSASNHVIIGGFGRFGALLARNLSRAKISYLALDIEPTRIAKAQALNYPVYYGDASRLEVLRSAGADRASSIVFAMDQIEAVGHAVVTAREAFPDLQIYARAWDEKTAQKLLLMGADYAVPETRESGLQLARDVLTASGSAVEQEALETAERYRRRHKPERAKQSDYRNILLVLTQHADPKKVLRYAAAFATDHQASLMVTEVLTESATESEEGVTSPEELDTSMAESRLARLDELIAPLRETLEVETKLLVGRMHEQITHEVVTHERDLVIKPVVPDSGWRQRVFGNEDSHLLRSCPAPVLLVRKLPPKPYRHRRVCAGVYLDETPGGHRDDRYPINRAILENSVWVAAAQFAELHIVHAWEAYGEEELRSGFSPFQFEAESYVEKEFRRNQDALDGYLTELRESMPGEALSVLNPSCHLVKGDHRDQILHKASELKVDLVVVGANTRTGLASIFAENTSLSLVRQLDCSVLVVKPPGFVTPIAIDDL